MIIRNSTQLLEHLSELEEKIKKVEMLLESLGMEVDRENILLALINRKKDE